MHLVGRYVCDRYRILRKVGEGGMGEVYAAEDVVGERMVALKVMRRDAEDPALAERFLREAETLARVRSRNVVRLYDFERDMDHGILFVAMELAMGDDLIRLLHHGRLTQPLALSVLQQAAVGLQAAHDEGIVHRDMKPANLKLKPKSDGSVRVKILDFGLVRDKHSRAELTDLGKAPGTVTYMPPEVFKRQPMGPAGDIYSLGVIAYEMLAGFAPFTGATPLAVATQHLNDAPEPLASLVPEAIPPELVSLIADMLTKDPESRIASAVEVHERVVEIQSALDEPFVVSHRGASKEPFSDWALLAHL